MTLSDLEAYVQNFLQFTYANGNWTQPEIQQYLRDEELRMFVHIVGKDEDFFETSTTLSEVASQAVYTLPTNFYKCIRVERIQGANATPQLPIPLNVVDKNASSISQARGAWWPSITPGTVQAPMHYMVHGQSTLELIPSPSNSTANSLTVYYAARPIGMFAPTDVPFQIVAGGGGPGKDDLREWHDIIALGACEKALLHEEAYPQADRVKMLKNERLSELTNYLAQINVQQPRYIQITDSVYEG